MERKSKKPRIIPRLKNILVPIFVFFVCFFTLLYVFFPYKNLKSYLESQMRLAFIKNDALMTVNIESLGPYWLTGFELKGVKVQSSYENQRHPLEIKKINVRLSFWPLLIGHLNFNGNIQLADGSSHVFASLPLFSVLRGNFQNFEIETTFNHFEIESFLDQYLGMLQNSTNPNFAVFVRTIASTSFGGYLDGKVYMSSDKEDRNGFVSLNIEKFYMLVDDLALNIPIQNFKQAKVEFSWDDGIYQIKDNTTFESQNIYLKPKGTVQMVGQGRLAMPILNLELLLILSDQIEKNFGFLIPQLLKCPSGSMVDGVMNVKLMGPISQYTCQ